ncbi:MAG: SCO family protein [Motiliproteus sp.]
MTQKLTPLKWITLAIAALAVATTLSLQNMKDSKPQSPYSGLGGDFTLTGHQGPVSLKDYRGKVVVMMFGFTSCPDVCPTGLANVSAALGHLNEAELKTVDAFFISVDPDRDTPERLDQYTRYFNKKIQGISGSKTDIDKVVGAYGAFYQMVSLPDSELKYSVDHSARIYLIDTQGQLAQLMFHNAPPAELAAEIKKLI